MQTFAYLRIWF